MAHALQDVAVVVTGASSGIGLASAEALARSGATVAVVARRHEPLERLADRHRGDEPGGGQVIAFPADVTDPQAMEDVAAEVVARTGRLDAWVNNAAVQQYGLFEEVPLDEWRRVIEVNLLGYVHGARAALPWFREQGTGVLVNVASVLAKVPAPLQSAYVVSKHGIRALSDTLRQELRDVPEIAVCTVLPGPIDTPLFEHAANRTGSFVKPPEPTVDATRVASAITAAIQRPRREIPVSASTRVGLLARRLAPALTERLGAPVMEAGHFERDRYVAPHGGNVEAPVEYGTTISGGWPTGGDAPDGRARIVLTAGAALAAAAVLTSRTRSR